MKIELEKSDEICKKGELVADMNNLKAQLIYADCYYDKWLVLVSHVDSAGNIYSHVSYDIKDGKWFVDAINVLIILNIST